MGLGHVLRPLAVVLGGAISVTAIQCGSSLTAGPGARVCGQSEDDERNERRPHFVTRQILGAADEGATALYRLNTGTMTAEPVLIRTSYSSDAWAIRDAKSEEVLLLERFSGQRKSRLTRAACTIKVSRREFGRLPPNTFGLGYFGDESLLALGWNDGSLVRLSRDFKETLLDIGAPILSETQKPVNDTDRHFNSMMMSGGRVFILTTGYDLKQFKPAQAKVLALSEDLRSVEWAAAIPECYNAYQDYTLQAGAREVIVGCNPQYQGDKGNNRLPVRLVRVSITEEGRLETRELARPREPRTHFMIPSGLSASGDWLFVTEETVTEESADTASPGLFLQSYWLSLGTGERRQMGKVGGRVIYDKVEDSYILSCQAASAVAPCKPGGFVVLKASSWDKPEAAEWKPVQFDYEFFQFERFVF